MEKEYAIVYVGFNPGSPEGRVIRSNMLGLGELKWPGPSWPELLSNWGKKGHLLCGQVTNVLDGNTIGFWATFKLYKNPEEDV